jgi:hypothetical protein
MYHLVVVAVVVVQFALLGYLVVDGFIALRWRRTIWLHMPTVISVLYPTGWAGSVPVAVFALVAVSWALCVWRGRVSANDEL